MRAREFISEAPATAAQVIGSKTATQSGPAKPDADNRLSSLGQTSDIKQPGMMRQIAGGAARGFKAGLGMNPDQSLGSGILSKTLRAMNMPATADAVSPGQRTRMPYTDNYTLSPQQLEKFRVGAQIKHPTLGMITVKKSSPQGVTFDTTHTLGHDFSMRPYQVRQLGDFK
jgi:hypothetical protein